MENIILEFSHQFRNCRDFDNLIIKSHILTEHALNNYINDISEEKSAKILKYTFAQKIEIAQILGLYSKNKNLKAELLALNSLRNSMAHSLQFEKKLLTKYLSNYRKIKKIFTGLGYDNLNDDDIVQVQFAPHKMSVAQVRFILLTIYICGIIDGVRDAKGNKTKK